MNADLVRGIPRPRDVTVFRLVVIEGKTTRAVAEAAKISQTRVRQIVARVTRWLAETLPEATKGVSPDAALQLAQSVAAARLDGLYAEATSAWRKTSQIKFAGLMVRVSSAMMKLPVLPGLLDGLLAGPEEEEERMTNDQGPMTNDPPVRDCSATGEFQADEARSAAGSAAANGDGSMPCGDVTSEQQVAWRAFLNAAQPLLTSAERHAAQEVQITPQAAALQPTAVERTQSRRERRRQLRAKLKAKAK